MASDEEPVRPERPERAPAGGGPAPSSEPDDLPDTIRNRLERLVPELVKKTFAAGLGAVFSTEEGIRKLAREGLPEVAGYLASSADGAKDRVFDAVARETREFLSGLNVGEEIAKILTTLSLEIKTEIRFIPNSDRFVGAEPDVKAAVRIKRAERTDRTERTERTERKDDEVRKDDDSRDPARDSRSRLRFWQRDRDRDDKDRDEPPPDDEPPPA